MGFIEYLDKNLHVIAILLLFIIVVVGGWAVYKDWHKTDNLGGFSISADN